MLYCIVLYCILLYYIGLDCIVLDCIVFYCIVLYYIHCIVLYCMCVRVSVGACECHRKRRGEQSRSNLEIFFLGNRRIEARQTDRQTDSEAEESAV